MAKYEMLAEHKNIVKFYRAWEEDRILYIQMELCELRYKCFHTDGVVRRGRYQVIYYADRDDGDHDGHL